MTVPNFDDCPVEDPYQPISKSSEKQGPGCLAFACLLLLIFVICLISAHSELSGDSGKAVFLLFFFMALGG